MNLEWGIGRAIKEIKTMLKMSKGYVQKYLTVIKALELGFTKRK